MSQKFLSNIELNAGLVDANDAAGTSGQVLSSTGTGVEWIDQAAITGAESNKTYYEVKNSSGATILKGKGVMAVGTDGNSGHILIDEMVADGTVEPRYFMGILEDSLDNGEIGTVIAFGELDQFNTSGQNGETWTDGQILWCDPDSAGDFTITQPTAPAVKISAAFILKASTQGKIQIRVQANEGLHELHDTHITTQSDGEILVWDNTNEYWFNDGTLTVDYTNGRVGIGTSLPNSALEVASSVTFSNVDTFGQFVIKSTSGTTGDLLNFGVDSTNSLAFIQANDRGTSSIPLILQRYSGDVGIGVTPSSGYKLDVSGSIRTNSNLVANNVYSGSGTFVFGLSTSLGEYITSVGNDIRFYAGGSIVTTIDGDNSRFGIGTTAPSTTLEVAGDTYLNGKVGIGITPTTTWDLRIKGQYPLGLQDSSGVATFEFYADLKENRYLNGSKIVGYNQDLSIDTTSSSYDILLANNGGNVGVGTDSPVGKLTVDIDSAGTVLDLKRDDGVNGRLYLTFGSAQTNLYSSGLYSFNVAGTEKMRIDSSGNVTLSGALKGPSTFYIDPSPDDTAEPGGTTTDTGTVVILGDLQVTGTTTTIDSTTLNVGDKNIVLASNATTAAEANGAGITINGANATLTYASTTDDFTFNKNITANNITAGDGTADNLLTAYHSDNSRTEVRGYGILMSRGSSYLRPMADGTQTLYIGGSDASWDWAKIFAKYSTEFSLKKNGTETFRIDDNTRIMSGNLMIDSTTVIDSSRNLSVVYGTFSSNISVNSTITTPSDTSLKLTPNGTGHIYFGNAGNGNKMYHYSSLNDGIYTTFDHTATLTRFNTTASDGFKFDKNVEVSGNVLATSFIKSGGTSSQFLKADGSVDSNSYSTTSHNHDDRYYTESEIQTFFDRGYLNSESAVDLAVGWYTIATNTGDRALGEFQIWDTASGDHQSVLFNASHHYGKDTSNDITVLANSRYSGTNFRYIRIKGGGTYDGAALQVYVDGATNGVYAAIVGGNAQSSGWVLKDWIPDATDPGDLSNYSSFSVRCQVDLDLVINGGIITTGDIYSGGQVSQFRVLTTGDEGSGNGLDADTLDGLQASQFLRSDESDTMTGSLYIVPTSANPALNVGRATGTPNIKSSDSYLLMDSNGSVAGLNWYTSDNVILANGGGNVGIGTTSPDEELSVIGSAGLYGTVSSGIISPASLTFYTSENTAGLGDSVDTNKQLSGDIVWYGKDSSLNAAGKYASIESYIIDSNNLIQGSAGEGGQLEFNIWRHDTSAAARVKYNAITINNSANVGIGTDNPTRKLSVSGSIEAGGKTTYTKAYSSLSTTGSAVAGLTNGSNGSSACFIFTCFGGGGYQRVIYSCANVNGVWNISKDIDEGVNVFDVSATTGTAITFTFKARTSAQSYSPTVTVEHHGSNLNTTYL